MSNKKAVTYLASLNQSLKDAMAENDRVVVIGEDICDPYGGAFKVTKGLSTSHPERVFNSPISEGAISGIAGGLALRGFLPVVEIMFGDFLALCADQLLNGISKFPLMYKDKVEMPVVIRTPMGGGRGYGPTHSQSIEKMFLGMPGLRVVSPSPFHDSGALLKKAVVDDRSPVLFLENKVMYPKLLATAGESIHIEEHAHEDGYPVMVAKNYDTGEPDAVVIGYGIVGQHVQDMLEELREEEIRLLGIFPSAINQPLPESILPFVKEGHMVIVAEEATEGFGWSGETVSDLYERLLGSIKKPIIRLSSEKDAIPSAREAEEKVLLTADKIKEAIFEGLL